MRKPSRTKCGLLRALTAGTLVFTTMQSTQAALSDGLVSYWPMETVQGTKTPDLVNGYDMNLNNLTAADLVDGKIGKCFTFSNARQTLLSRVHGAADDLPANKHEAFTIAFWANVTGTGQTDLRLFSEGFTPNNNTPLFNLGTASDSASGSVDVFIRQTGWTEVTHIKTDAQPLDGTWHHIVFVQRTDGTRTMFVDGAADPLEIPAKPEGLLQANDTTIGGILRASASHWVTGLIDEVAIWKRGLTDAEVMQVKNEGLVSVFPPEGVDLVSHWPLDEVLGTKTPDVVSGYDMNLNNLTAADLVDGKIGKAFSFSNARQTLLSRVHGAADDLPANKHEAFTIAFWANVNGTGQTDLRLFSEGFTPNNNTPLFNLGTASDAASGSVDVFIRQTGWTEVTHIKTDAQPLDGTWHHIVFVQRADGTRTIFVDGVADLLEIPAKPAGLLQANDTTIGGILRASASHWVTGLIDDVAIWKRGLTDAEVMSIKNNGVPNVISRKAPLEIKSFTADFPLAAIGDKVMLRWEGSKDANYSISGGVGDVTTATLFGVGSKEVTLSSSTTFTITATRGTDTLTKQVTVGAVPGVAAGWHVLDTFSAYTNGPLAGQGPWLGAEGVFNVVDMGTNTAIGFADGADLTAIGLRAFGINEGQKGTVSFRVYVPPINPGELIPPIGVHVGITERSIRFNGDFNANVGPYVRVERLADIDSVDIQARNGVNTGFYEGIVPAAILPGQWYRIWIDVDNKGFDVVDGVQNGGDIYSVYIQKEGDAARTTLFENYVADRDTINVDPALGAPTTNLTYVFISTPGAGQLDNMLLLDDFFISTGAYNSTVPYTPPTGPTEITITRVARNGAKIDITWGSLAGVPYTIQRKAAISDAWANLAAGQIASGASSTYSDDITGGSGFYRVVYQP